MKYFPDYKELFKVSIILMLFLNSCSNQKSKSQFYYPADFDSVRTTCFIWTDKYYEMVPKLIGIISAKDKVTVFWGENDTDLASVNKILEKYDGNFKNINLIKVNQTPKSKWIRDYGPIYLINELKKSKLVEFGYFGKPLGFTKEIALKMKLPIVTSSLNSSGGARETNGKGTIILCETHELDVNKSKPKIQIENEYKEKLGIKNIIWMKRGIPQDDSRLNGPLFDQIYPNGVNGHIDQFCRFADAGVILISSVSEAEAKQHPILAEAKKRLDENYAILLNSVDQEGEKFKVVKVPFAPLLFMERTVDSKKIFITPVTSYMNFIVTNSMVIVPSYTSAQPNDLLLQNKEKDVEDIFRKAFPTREIIKVQAADLNSFSGGFHCISINEPLTTK